MKTDFLKLPSDGNIYSFGNNSDSFSHSLYDDKLEKFKNIFKEICGIDNEQIESRIIGILGNRGSGKSSFLKVAINKIKGDEKKEENSKIIILDPIDPSILDDQLNILELIISKIASEVEGERKNTIDKIDDDSFFCSTDGFEYTLNNFYGQLEKVNKTLSSLRIDRKDLAKGLSTESFTEDLKNKVNFIKEVNCLIDRFVSVKGKKDMKVVCVIDDLDLISNKYIVKEIEMLSKFIAYTKLIVILAYRPKQLENTLLAESINENKILLDENVIDINELEDRVNNQLSKLIPHNHQILLPEQSVAMAKPMYDYLRDFLIKGKDTQQIRDLLTSIDLSGEKHYDGLSVKDWLTKAIFNATGLTFEPTKNNEFYDNFFTKNLRDLIQFLKVIFDMDMFENNSDINSVELSDVVTKKLKNIEKFESYLNLIAKSILPSNLIEVYNKIKNSDIKEHNYVIYREIFNLLGKLDNEINTERIDTYKNGVFQNYILNINYISSENVSLGDVLNIIEILEFSYQRFLENNSIYKLIYFIKINYSILLMKNILGVIDKEDNKEKMQISKNNYILLLNGKVTTSFIAYNKRFRKPFIWPTNSSKDSNITMLLRDVLPYMVYTNRSSLGSQTREVLSDKDVIPLLFNRRYFINAVSKEGNNIKYWNLRNPMMKFEMQMFAKRNYNLDPLAYLTHQDYIEEQIEMAKRIFTNTPGDEKKLGYLVTDVFQLDLINTYNYADDSKDTWANYTLERINNYLTYQRINREASMLADCFQSLFAYKGENFKYMTPYNPENFKGESEEENSENNNSKISLEGVSDLLNSFSNEAGQNERRAIIDNITKQGTTFLERKRYLKKLAPAPNKEDKAVYEELTRPSRKRISQSKIEQPGVQGMLNRTRLRDEDK
ncbi:P-loop NTPase fold protein [Liquorilactobacillus capillatus]|uniref:KAP NTPase domain-containing protein n=1 Tax=Liquorilactobacillus capillatus DSM 19910 TaxID=1423731 RepID=A0A0R1M3H8_9LACO|nr:P-loop NTPase fold protein [Liquorilactobacillus capillatus]KRL02591.1 hypothetical protein FC81_GL000628 [Liquorilactobacillus capillatus DSM 19910]